LRRRRRHSTQLFRSETNFPPYGLPAAKPPKKWLRYVSYFFLLAVVCVASYYVYENYYYPPAAPLSSKNAITPSTDVPAAVSALPVGEDEISVPALEKKIQIEILNGCGKEGVAKVFQNYLQQQGFDVINTDNYVENGKRRWDIPASLVIARTGNLEPARDVAKSLGISDQKVISKPDPHAVYDVSVVLGRDYMILRALTSDNR
jgi:hypothetical protein